jgi:orotate phosphoribosyltransferase
MKPPAKKVDGSKYLRVGNRELSSGIGSEFYWDFRELDEEDRGKLLSSLVDFLASYRQAHPGRVVLVGVKTMGWEVARRLPDIPLVEVLCFDPHAERGLLGEVNSPYFILDDVITTGGTISQCIREVGALPVAVLCYRNRVPVYELTR